MSKFLYPIYKLKTKSYIKWWLYYKKAGGSGVLSEILQGFSFNLENTLNRKFKLFEIEGNSVQDGSPSPDNEVPILSSGDNENLCDGINQEYWLNTTTLIAGKLSGNTGLIIPVDGVSKYTISTKIVQTRYRVACIDTEISSDGIETAYNGQSQDNTNNSITIDTTGHNYLLVNATSLENIKIEKGTKATPYSPYGMGSINEKITNSDETEEQDYSIFVQQPMRSIGDVRDCFVKKSDGWYERHLPYIASYNGETLPQDVYNEVDNVKYCNEKSMSTTGQFSIGASVQYIDENNWNDLPCTETQIQQLENLPSTYKDFTIIQSEDETPAHLKIQYYKEG